MPRSKKALFLLLLVPAAAAAWYADHQQLSASSRQARRDQASAEAAQRKLAARVQQLERQLSEQGKTLGISDQDAKATIAAFARQVVACDAALQPVHVTGR